MHPDQNAKIKIAYIIDTIGEKMGGTEQQLLSLLANIDSSKFVSYLCYFKEPEWLDSQNFKWPVYYFKFTTFYSPLGYWRLYKFSRFLKQEGIDIVQTYFRDGNMLGIFAARLAGIKKIISTRRNQGYWHNKIEINILKFFNRFVYRFVANSKSIKKYVSEVENVPIEKIDVIYNGILSQKQLDSQQIPNTDYKKILKIPEQEIIITLIANLRPVKGIDVLLKSIPEICKEFDNIHLLIIGDGEEKDALLTLANKLDIVEKISFLGFRNDTDLILSISDIGILSSHSEGLSNSVIEYMAAGLPVVATDVGGNPELISDGVNGFLVPPNDPHKMAKAILKLLRKSEMRIKMGELSSEKVKNKFLLEGMIKKTEDFFRSTYENLPK